MAQVYFIHSDFYYVKEPAGGEILECRLREILKKQKAKVMCGDYVELEENNTIKAILPRKNSISRPAVANLDKVVVTSAYKMPDLDFIQLNRYLTFLKYHNIPAMLCFNKEDLNEDDGFEARMRKIYEPLGYELFFTSAIENVGIENFKNALNGLAIALCGQSGVGKSSVLNAINPNFKLKTGDISPKQGRGTHTTRHCQIFEFDGIKIVDTPGFSRLGFDFLLPQELGDYFEEIKQYKHGCKFGDCLHDTSQSEDSCNVLKNIDNIEVSRYESYLAFLKETKEYKTQVTYGSQKVESSQKSTGGELRAKISSKKRTGGRNTAKQRMKKEIDD
jgi:ribosome biogenesis GTPase